MRSPGEMAEANRRVTENKYRRALSRMIGELRKAVCGLTTPQAIVNAVEAYARTDAFRELTRLAVSRMITSTQVGQKTTWRVAAASSMRGREIYLALQQELFGTAIGAMTASTVARNSQLIKTVPSDIAQRLSSFAAYQAVKGIRPEETAAKMQKLLPELTNTQITRIARTETAKAQTALMEARCQTYGIQLYQWYTCNDERVRDSHALMQGVYCRWDDPPDPERLAGEKSGGHPYHPGGIYNCRCIALPVIDAADIAFPARVHVHGRIYTVNNLNALKAAFAA